MNNFQKRSNALTGSACPKNVRNVLEAPPTKVLTVMDAPSLPVDATRFTHKGTHGFVRATVVRGEWLIARKENECRPLTSFSRMCNSAASLLLKA
ncbi:hypothetical protein [Pseudomonas sp. 1152_12]|uniref:hypothetical protein n=1 Tax=Pseudomonas sp. 1152_12 TaxID=2604455 RepID=UPI0040640989